MAHKPTVRSFLQMNNVNDAVQGTPNLTRTWMLLPILYKSFGRGYQVEDEITDEEVNSGNPWMSQADVNYGHPLMDCGVWPNASELHAILTWWMERVGPTHTYPMTPADVDLYTTRQVVGNNADVQFMGHGILPEMEIRLGRKEMSTVNLKIPLMNKTQPDVTAKASRLAGASIWRKHVTINNFVFGGNLSVHELTMKLSAGYAAVPPAFGSASYNTLQFDKNGLYKCEFSATGYAGEGFDPAAIVEANSVIDFTQGITFNDGTRSFTLGLGNAKVTSPGDAENDGSRMWKLESKVVQRPGGFFMSLGTLA